MFELIDDEGAVVARYSDSFTPTQIIQDALQHNYLSKKRYIAGFPAAEARPGHWLVMGVTYQGGYVECTNFWIHEGQ